MADIELKPGSGTSEYNLSRLVTIGGALVAVAGVALETAAQLGFGNHWVGLGLTVVGLLAKVAESAGYRRQRFDLKATAIEASVAQGALASQNVKDLDDALKAIDGLLSRHAGEKQ